MAEEQWLTFQQAVEIVRSRLNASVGRSDAIVRTALASGEIRTQFGYTFPDDYRFDWPNTVDFLDWLDRHHPTTTRALQAPLTRRRGKRDRVMEAIAALWADRPPDQTAVSNAAFCTQVVDWLKADCRKRGIRFSDVSNDTILRAARAAGRH